MFFESIYIDQSLQKHYISLAPNCMSLCRVTRKIVATIGTFFKIIPTRHHLGKLVALCVGQMNGNLGLIWEPICNKVLPFADTVSEEESLHLSGTWGEKFALNWNQIVIYNWKQYSLSWFLYYQTLFTFIYSWLRFFQFCGVGGLVIVHTRT